MARRNYRVQAIVVCLAMAATEVWAQTPAALPEPTSQLSSTDRMLADTLATVVRESIPLEYSKQKDWGQTKRITVGVTTDQPLYKLKLHRRKKHVPHGTWKQYRVHFINPEEELRVEVENLHSLAEGGVGLRMILQARLEGWAQMRHYNRGVHLLTLTGEGTSRLELTIDCEVRIGMTDQGLAIDPRVAQSKLDVQDFEVRRIGEVKGKLAKEIGDALKHLMEDQLEGPKLTAKLNRAIDKKRDRFVLAPNKLAPWWSQPTFTIP